MSEKFTAGSGKTYWRGFYGYLQETEGVVLGPKNAEDVKEFFLWERDRELGRWRDPEAPNMVAYPDRLGGVTVADEETGLGGQWSRVGAFEYEHMTAPTARRYFRAHPAPRELPTEVGAIIEGNGVRLLRGAPGYDTPWVVLGVDTDEFDPWLDDQGVLEAVGPDWRVIHEGMKEQDDA